MFKTRHKVYLLLLVVVIGLALYGSNRHEHSTTATTDRADLALVGPSSTHVAAGRAGTVEIRIVNRGPDRLDDHTVTFTVTTPQQLLITGGGTVAGDSEAPFPDSNCVPRGNGHTMTCSANLTLDTTGQLSWRIPVKVDARTPANTQLRLTVNAVGGTFYVDPDESNNTNLAVTVVAGPAAAPPSRTPTSGRTPTPSPTRTSASSRPPPSRPAAPATTSDKSAGHTARRALDPAAIAVWALVGVVAVAVTVLAVVARRQRRRPVDDIPPQDDTAD